jgi:hypothetical protein
MGQDTEADIADTIGFEEANDSTVTNVPSNYDVDVETFIPHCLRIT